jgi:hypothetical protein
MLEQSNRLNNSSGTLRLFLVLLFSFSISTLFAQIPSDLSKVKSAQITDAQLSQFLAQAQASGMTEEQVVQDFQRRGLPEAELQVLATRLKGIMGGSSTVKGGDNGDEKSVVQNKRKPPNLRPRKIPPGSLVLIFLVVPNPFLFPTSKWPPQKITNSGQKMNCS